MVGRNPVDTQYITLLGRLPEELERSREDADIPALTARLVEQPEFRNRFRDLAQSDANALMATALWPPEKRDYDLHIVIVSGNGWRKPLPVARDLAPQLGDRLWLSVLCGEAENEAQPQFPRTDFHVFPGESVFQLRARLPTILREAAWVAVLEDHAMPMPGWVDGATRAIQNVPQDTLSFTGSAANETSTRPWSWASFLFNFWQHWHPSAASRLQGTVGTTVFRRDLVGSRPLRIHEFEELILGRRGPVVNGFPVNHIQVTTWWVATARVFDNGRVAGSAIRRNSLSPSRTLKDAVRWAVGGRNREIALTLRDHPRAAELPSGTMWRVRWIALCHSAGAIFGALVGSGRAQKRLE